MSATISMSGDMSSTSSSLPVATTDSQSQTHSSLFSQGGSPGLILAFLAIGLFCGGVIVMFGMRRMSRGRRLTMRLRGAQNWEDPDEVQSLHFGRGGMQRDEPMRIPQLWELHKEDAKLMNWIDITPISAKFLTQDLEDKSSPTVEHSVTPSPPPSVSLTSRMLNWYRIPRPDAPHAPLSAHVPALSVSPPLLQMGVAIAMPSHHDRNINQESPCLDYCFGVVEVPWTADGPRTAALLEEIDLASRGRT